MKPDSAAESRINPLYKAGISLIRARRSSALRKSPLPEIAPEEFDYLAEPKAGRFTAGFGKTTVMPKEVIPSRHKYYVAGYRINNPATGILDDLYAKAVWLDDNSGRGACVFVSVDCVGLFSIDVQRIKKRLNPFCDVMGVRSLNICSTHTHAGIDTMGLWGPLPRSGRDPEFIKIIIEGVTSAVKKAYDDRRDGRLFREIAHADPGAQRVRRPPHKASDRLTSFRFVPDDGSREVYMLNFTSHPESLLGANSLVSADFPACAAKYISEHAGGAEMLYFPGALGGISMEPLDEDNIVSTKKTGERLGELMLSPESSEELPPVINCLRREFYMPCDNPVYIAAAALKIIPCKIKSLPGGSLNAGMRTEITYFDIGGVQLLLLPGELFPDLLSGEYLSAEESSTGASPDINPPALAEIAGDPELIVYGLSNDELGYILAPGDYLLDARLPFINEATDKFGRKHYPETNSTGPGAAYCVADAFSAVMKQVNEKRAGARE